MTITKDFAETLLSANVQIDHLITIPPKQAERNKVAGYVDLRQWAAERGIAVTVAKSYSLKGDEDIAAVNALNLDLLLVQGWQRLIPDAILMQLRIGAFGMHGSPDGLPRGRGRSPLNWSLITDRKSFRTYLFRYDAGVDSGDYVDYLEFDINPFDTCETLHLKNTSAMVFLVKKYLPLLVSGQVTYHRQQGEPSYYPKREPEDGGIDWTRTAAEIHNFVRALTRPYPGAFTFAGDRKLFIWRGQPFDSQLPFQGAPGTVVATSQQGLFVVQTGEGTYLVTEYEPEGETLPHLSVGELLRSVSHEETLQRIMQRYPEYVTDDQKEIK